MFSKTATGLLTAALLLGASSSAHAAQTLKLDLANPANLDPAGVATQSAKLKAKVAYLVTVSGTGSLWDPALPAPVTCGLPETTPVVEPTPGQPPAPAETDAALLFAAPQGVWLGADGDACATTGPAVSLPLPTGFRFGGAAGMVPQVPIGGTPKVPNAAHTYTYSAIGDGTPLRFQFADMYVADNSGILTITIRKAPRCIKRVIRHHVVTVCVGPGTQSPTVPTETQSRTAAP